MVWRRDLVLGKRAGRALLHFLHVVSLGLLHPAWPYHWQGTGSAHCLNGGSLSTVCGVDVCCVCRVRWDDVRGSE
jgi:hypothetical protein